MFWWQGNVTPPRVARRVGGTWCARRVRHLIDRYGLDEVRDLAHRGVERAEPHGFWQGADQDAYHRLYEVDRPRGQGRRRRRSRSAARRSPRAADEWLEPLRRLRRAPRGPGRLRQPARVHLGPAQHVPFGVHQTLRPAADLLEQFAAPRRQLSGTALADLPVHITEFNSSYRPDNPIHDTACHAAYLAPVLAAGGDLVDSFSYWTFSDMFEEAGIPTSLFHGGFGLLTHRQINKPTYHLYAFMARLGDGSSLVATTISSPAHADGRITVLAWTPVGPADADGWVSGAGPTTHAIALSVPLPGSVAFVGRQRVNEEVGNAYAAWAALGRPPSPNARELDALHDASRPGHSHEQMSIVDGRASLDLMLARNEVTLVELTPVHDADPVMVE